MILKLAEYTMWSCRQMIANLRAIDETLLNKEIPYVVNDTDYYHACIRSLIEHIIIGIEFCTRVSHGQTFRGDEVIQSYRNMDNYALLDHWIQISSQFLEVIRRQLGKTVQFNDNDLQLDEDFYFSFLNHVNYHKGQLNLTLRILGEKGELAGYTTFLKESYEKT